MSTENTITEIFGEVIHSYTRAQAIKDGVLVDLSGLFPADTRLYKYPVACTSELWSLIEGDSAAGYVWDLCYMSANAITQRIDASSHYFACILPRSIKDWLRTKEYRLKIIVGPGDHAEPVITIMFDHQD